MVEENKFLQLKNVYLEGFPDDGERFAQFFISKRTDQNTATVAIDEKIVSAGYVVPKRARFFGKETDVAYFSAVSTLNEFRGKGYASKVVKKLLNIAYSNGSFISVLSPFNDTFYLKFGFTNASYYGKIKINGNGEFSCRPTNYEDFSMVYSAQINDCDFALLYEKDEFNTLLEEYSFRGEINTYLKNDKPVAVVAVDNIVERYITDGVNINDIGNLYGKTALDLSLKEKVNTQLRIVNVEKFLQAVKYQGSNFNYCIKVTDDILSQNTAIYKITVLNGRTAVEKISPFARIRVDEDITVSQLAKNFIVGGCPFVEPKIFLLDTY